MNLSLDQHLPPSRGSPNNFKYPAKMRSLRDGLSVLDISKTKNGPSTKLLLDLNRAQQAYSPVGGRRVREALDGMSQFTQASGSMAMHQPDRVFDPFSSQTVMEYQRKKTSLRQSGDARGIGEPGASQVGSFNNILQQRTLEALLKARMGRVDKSEQVEWPLYKHDFPDLATYQKWSNNEVEPFLKQLRKSLLASRPVDINQYIISYCEALRKGQDPPEHI